MKIDRYQLRKVDITSSKVLRGIFSSPVVDDDEFFFVVEFDNNMTLSNFKDRLLQVVNIINTCMGVRDSICCNSCENSYTEHKFSSNGVHTMSVKCQQGHDIYPDVGPDGKHGFYSENCKKIGKR